MIKIISNIVIVCLFLGCSKEKVLKKNSYIDEDALFLSGYINNKNDKSIAIFGYMLQQKGIRLFIDTGLGWQQMSIKYDNRNLAYYCDLQQISFKPNKLYRFKMTSEHYRDSLLIEKMLPDSFNAKVTTNYPSKLEFLTILSVNGKWQKTDSYTHDIYTFGSRGDTLNQVIPISGNLYQAKFLPYLRDLSRGGTNLEDFETINGVNIYNGIRLPYQSTFSSQCVFTSIVQKYWFTVTRFYKSDFEYINSICDNVKNEGNPFFLNYQPKHINRSNSGKLYGIIVGTYISGTNTFTISDPSDTLLTISIRLNGKDIIDDPNYRITRAVVKNFSFDNFYMSNGRFCFTENVLRTIFEDCQNGSKYDKTQNITIQFAVRDKATNITKLTNSIVFKYENHRTDLVFNVQ